MKSYGQRIPTNRRASPLRLTIIALLAASGLVAAAETTAPPPNAPATVEWNGNGGQLRIHYRGDAILEAAVGAERADGKIAPVAGLKLEPTEATGEKVEGRLRISTVAPQEGVQLLLRGVVAASEEAFAAETEGPAQKRFPLVRTSVGPSRNLRNNAIYDRRWDWVLVGPGDGATRIEPKAADKQSAFAWESRGASIELVFRPRFYQKHRDLASYEPWTYPVWKGPITGYCTWWAYRDGFSQKTLDAIVDVFAEKHLPDFGYAYVQIDDSYQIGNGSCPQNWLTWNGKFPGGAEYAVRKIKSAGMKPGIWVHRVHRPSDPNVADIGKRHPDWFIHKPNGDLFMDAGFYILNTRNKDAIEGMARPIYREIKKQGWEYVKIDGAGDLLSCYKNAQCAEHFKAIGITPEQSLRDWDVVAREELGRDVYILNCWGVWPGKCVIGLVDGCRLGGDGFQWNTLLHNNTLNGVVWRGDPDHCDILAEGAKDKTVMKTFGAPAAMADTIDQPAVVAMAGSALMVSDRAEAYRDDANLEGMKRSAPVLFTVPGQLFDGGSDGTWWLQEIDRPFEHWSVLARFNWRQEKLKWKRADSTAQEVKFADLGLERDREYLVFEFWTQTSIGRSKGSFEAPALSSDCAMQVFAIREARPHPWVLSTTRHISQGGVSILEERWDAEKKELSGKSAVVIGDPYALTVHIPKGFKLESAEIGGEKAGLAGGEETGAVRIVPTATRTVGWKIGFAGGAAAASSSSTPAEAKRASLRPMPPEGWNSYTGYSIAVTEAELLKNIDFLSEKLLAYGYDTVTVDNGWFLSGQGDGVSIALDAYGRPEAHEHFFPHGLKHTVDYANRKGVKFGIWLLRGINRRAVTCGHDLLEARAAGRQQIGKSSYRQPASSA